MALLAAKQKQQQKTLASIDNNYYHAYIHSIFFNNIRIFYRSTGLKFMTSSLFSLFPCNCLILASNHPLNFKRDGFRRPQTYYYTNDTC